MDSEQNRNVCLFFYQHMKGVLVVEEKTEADLNHLKMFNVETH